MKQLKLTFLLTMLMNMVGAKALAHDIAITNSDGITIYYNYFSDNEVEVSFKGSYYSSYPDEYSGIVSIPESVSYAGILYKVTSIGENAFRDCTKLASVIIPENITCIGENAFRGCTNITSANIPNGVTRIESCAFTGCTGISSFIIPESITFIGNSAFSNCSNLTSVSIPNSLNNISSYAFSDCVSLSSVDIPSSVISIGNGAFLGCTGLLSVNIPFNVSKIGDFAFWDCFELKNVTLSEGINSIGAHSFGNCLGLASVFIPNSVKTIGVGVFEGCSNLTSIIVDSENNVYDSRNNCNAIIETSSNTLIEGCTNSQIPIGVTTIGEGAFNNCVGLASIIIPNGVKEIDMGAFYGCHDLTSIIIPSSVTAIGDVAFGDCSSLKVTVIGNSVETIGRSAFSGCSSLTSIVIPNSVTGIGSQAFQNCDSLLTVKVMSSTPVSIDYSTFSSRTMATLFVPVGSKAAYEAAYYWKEFKEIVEMPNQSVQFVDEAGNKMEDGSTITITEGEDDGWGGIMFPSGLYVQNTSNEDIYVGIDYDVKELPNGSFQLCFPQNCINKTKTGASKTEVGLLQADAKRSLMAEWIPEENGYGTCTVDFKVNMYTYNSSTNQYELQAEGPTVTVKMVYSDGGDTPQPSTNVLSASAPTILKGKQAALSVNLKNQDELIACEFDLQLPSGITIAKDEDDDPIATLSSRASKHSMAVSDKGNGLYHFLCYSNSNKAFSGNEGELLSIELLCDGNMAVGTYQTTVKNIIFSDVDKNKITPANYTFDLVVIEAEPGDVNNDGEINVMDVVEMVAYIMGDASEGFVFAAADLYPDGAINVMDLVNLVDLIMHPSSPANAREWTENGMSLSTMDDGVVAVKVNNLEQFVASEFIVEVSAGQTLEAVTVDKHHHATCSQLDDSHYKVMTYSSENSTYSGDALVQLHIIGEGMVNVSDALLVDENHKGVAFAPTAGGYTTGIEPTLIPSLKGRENVYDLQGRKRGTSRPNKHEVLIVNGKKQVVK